MSDELKPYYDRLNADGIIKKVLCQKPLTPEEDSLYYEYCIRMNQLRYPRRENKMYKTDVEVKATTGAFQGDVGFVPAKLPKGAKKVKSRILALGEATGHHHVLTEEAQVYELAEQLFFEAGVGAKLLHQEHDAIRDPYASSGRSLKNRVAAHIVKEMTIVPVVTLFTWARA
jgi:hypothetical protein